jgi:dihydropteroate synthase
MVQLVGILNITPDSFSDGGLFVEPAAALGQADQLFADGADMIDVGAESTNPRSKPLDWQEEWQRLQPVLPELLQRYPGRLSLDTYHPETAERALQLGEITINDITGLQNPAMREVVLRHAARCIVSQLPRADAQAAHTGELLSDMQPVIDDLLRTHAWLAEHGLPAENIILDPGIGFGKTPELNWKLLKVAAELPGYAVMIGYSRKRFLGEQRMELAPNLSAADIAVASGAAYLRVHDVAGHARHLRQAA